MSDRLSPGELAGRLALAEQTRLAFLEHVVEAGLQTFVDVGLALAEIRDGRLYRSTHGSFERYLDERWGMSRSRGYRLIDGARVAELVSRIGDITNEAQARELVPLLDDEAELADVWRELKVEHGDAVTAANIRTAVRRHLGDPEVKLGEALERVRVVLRRQNETIATLEAFTRKSSGRVSYAEALVITNIVKRGLRGVNVVFADAEDLLPAMSLEHPRIAARLSQAVAEAKSLWAP